MVLYILWNCVINFPRGTEMKKWMASIARQGEIK